MNRLGATVTAEGTRFEVWAPEATRVEVVLDDRRADLTHATSGREPGVPTWSGVIEGVGAGDRYQFSLDGGPPLPDPASRFQPDGVHGPSAVVDIGAFSWTDAGWRGVELPDAVIYELHIGTFTAAGTFDAAVGQLDRLAALGVSVIEVMPVNAFPGERNWGYDGVFPFATQESYGGPEAMARFVDAAHARGLAVILDVVYNHIGPEGNVLGAYAPYFTDAYTTPWGPAVNVAGADSDGVRRYLLENVHCWIEDFHLDGLRVDAVHAIIDPTARPFVGQLAEVAHAAGAKTGRTILVTLESASNDPRLVRPANEHGLGADAVWNDDVHHALRVALTGEQQEYYAAYRGVSDLARSLDERWVYAGHYSPTLRRRHGADATDVDHERFVVFSSNHDHAGNTPRGDRMLADAPVTDPRRRIAAAFVLLSPFTPMLFMGDEYGETAPFPYFIDHGDPDLVEVVRRGRKSEFAGIDWSGTVADPADPATFTAAVLDPELVREAPHRGLLDMHTELLRLRRSHPVLTSSAATQEVDLVDGVITVTRHLGSTTSTTTFNFTGAPAPVSRLGAADHGMIVFDTADPRWVGTADELPSDTGGEPGRGADVIGPFGARLVIGP